MATEQREQHGTCKHCGEPVRRDFATPWFHAYTFEERCSFTVAEPTEPLPPVRSLEELREAGG